MASHVHLRASGIGGPTSVPAGSVSRPLGISAWLAPGSLRMGWRIQREDEERGSAALGTGECCSAIAVTCEETETSAITTSSGSASNAAQGGKVHGSLSGVVFGVEGTFSLLLRASINTSLSWSPNRDAKIEAFLLQQCRKQSGERLRSKRSRFSSDHV